jgi:hypothetical protein
MIQCLCVEIDGEPYRQYTEPLYIGETKRNCELTLARSNKELWDQVLESALKEATIWRNRYQKFKELKPIVTAIDKTEKKLTKAKRRK